MWLVSIGFVDGSIREFYSLGVEPCPKGVFDALTRCGHNPLWVVVS
jgi:hypothetical protein